MEVLRGKNVLERLLLFFIKFLYNFYKKVSITALIVIDCS